MTTVSLGVVAYRDAPSLEVLLATATGFDEVLVANMSEDPAVAAACARAGAREVPVAGNPGFAAGVGALAAAATGDQLLFCNDDLELSTAPRERPGDVARRVALPGGVVLPRIVDDQRRPVSSVRALPTPCNLVREWVLLPDGGRPGRRVEKWRCPQQREPVKAGTAAAVLVDRQILLRHPLPVAYFLYWEELSWFWSLSDAGVPVELDPSFQVERHGGRSELGEAKWRLLGANLVRLGEERYGLAGRIGYAALAALWLGRLAATDLFSGERSVRWRARRAGFAGVRMALAGSR